MLPFAALLVGLHARLCHGVWFIIFVSQCHVSLCYVLHFECCTFLYAIFVLLPFLAFSKHCTINAEIVELCWMPSLIRGLASVSILTL